MSSSCLAESDLREEQPAIGAGAGIAGGVCLCRMDGFGARWEGAVISGGLRVANLEMYMCAGGGTRNLSDGQWTLM